MLQGLALFRFLRLPHPCRNRNAMWDTSHVSTDQARPSARNRTEPAPAATAVGKQLGSALVPRATGIMWIR